MIWAKLTVTALGRAYVRMVACANALIATRVTACSQCCGDATPATFLGGWPSIARSFDEVANMLLSLAPFPRTNLLRMEGSKVDSVLIGAIFARGTDICPCWCVCSTQASCHLCDSGGICSSNARRYMVHRKIFCRMHIS